MQTVAKEKVQTTILWSGVIVGLGALMLSDRVAPGSRQAVQIFGWLAFMPAWLKVSPCAGGRCATGQSETPKASN